MGKMRTNGDPRRISIASSETDGSYVLIPSASSGMTFNATQGGTAFTFSHQGTGSFDMTAFGGNGNIGYSSIEGGSNWTHTGTIYNDIILQSSDTTAEAAPTKADMVMLIEDAGSGVASLDTSSGNIKGWVSRYETGGTKTWTQVPLVDEGHWGTTDKRILAAHDVTLTGTSGTQMAYKITTHSASGTFNTRIHATSIGWR